MKEKIFLVDDNRTILRSFQLLYQGGPYAVFTFTNPLKALDVIKETGADVVIADHDMLEMEGTRFLEEVKRMLPDAERILMTGFAENAAVTAAINKGDIYHILRKPVDVQEMHLTIRNAVAHRRMSKNRQRLLSISRRNRVQLEQIEQSMEQRIERDTSELRDHLEKSEHTLAKVRSMLGSTIRTMQMIVETKDPYTAGHQRRVANLARAIATELHLSVDRIDGIRMAGVLHDIGKLYEPEEILNKPAPLTDSEFDLIKAHPMMGYDILKKIDFSWPVASIVLQHHERMDGSGYPFGISGDDILLESRIMAVADVVEAMASPRPHRKALGIDSALNEITVNKGTLYDATVADACIQLFSEKGFSLT
ncbi:MAG: HD domain-containing phosphohydrolase [bacterium]